MNIYHAGRLIDRHPAIHLFASVATYHRECLHTHDFMEIVYILSGSATEWVNGTAYEVERGDLVFINYGSTHEFEAKDLFTYVNICFHPGLVGDAVLTPSNAFTILQLSAFDEIRQEREGGMVSFRGAERDQLEALLSMMLEEYQSRGLSWSSVLESAMHILLLKMVRKLEECRESAEPEERWRDLTDYIDRHLDGDLSLSSLARRYFYNPSYFSRIFKMRFHMPLTEYVIRRKILCALGLAALGDRTTEEIAERSGFSSRTAFCRAFSRIMGMTFAEYQRGIKK